MKILVLTSTASTKLYLIIDKIIAYGEEGEDTVIRMLDGSWHYVKESVDFITQQLVSAAINSYIVYNSEEHNEN